jgi:hypothetical protein
MNTVTIIVVAIWNAVLFTALAAVIHWRKRVLDWITGLDGVNRDAWETGGDGRWAAFLAEHPELTDR